MPHVPPGSRSRRIVAAVASVLAVLCIVGLDRIAAARSWPIPVIGLLDEPAHLLTAWLVLNAVTRARTRSWPWVLLGVVAIDVDHVPLYLLGGPIAVGGGRPVTHSLITVLVLLVVAVAVRRARAATGGLAAGVLLHLLRDVATGPGVPVWWPVQPDSVLLPYRLYLFVLVALAAAAVAQQLLSRKKSSGKRSPVEDEVVRPAGAGRC
jgi:inner membrane protein